jgi:signal transduction histidine kinase
MNQRTAARLAWGSFVAYVVCGTASAVIGFSAVSRFSPAAKAAGWNGSSPLPNTILGAGFLLFPLVGALVMSRHPDNWLGRVLVLVGTYLAFGQLVGAYEVASFLLLPGRLPGGAVAATFDGASWVPMIVLMGVYVLLLFPDGHLPSPRWRKVAWIVGIGSTIVFLVILVNPGKLTGGQFPGVVNPLGIPALKPLLDPLMLLLFVIPGGILAAAVAVVGRFRRSRGVERLQMKWLVTAGAIMAVIYAVTIAWSLLWEGMNPAGAQQPLAITILQNVSLLTFALLPVAIGFAVLRYKLYEIDTIINRALVYGLLATFITVLYVAIVVGLGQLLGRQGNTSLSIAATAIIAVAFQPVRERVRRFANRLVYGKRSTPYELMAEFSRHMADTPSLGDVLPMMAATAASGVGAVRSRVRVDLPATGGRVATWPADADGGPFDRRIDVTHEGEHIGDIEIAKPPGEHLTPAEDALLIDLAAQAGLAMHNVRLAASLELRLAELDERSRQLEESRQRLVTARDAQRRGLERDIREGPQRQLMAIGQQLTHTSTLVAGDPASAASTLEHLGEEANATLEGLRDLARGIFPPLLADKGVASALDAHIRKVGAHAVIDATPAFNDHRFDVDTEACVYFCCLQAIQNVLRHAGNAPTTVGLDVNGPTLTFTVHDDGPGFDIDTTPEGMGVQIVRDRIAALDGVLTLDSSPGGGTTVTGRLPVALR